MINIANFLARWTLIFQNMRKYRFFVFLVHSAKDFTKDRSLVKRFTVASAIIMLLGMLGIGWWIGERIKAGVIKQATATTALYMDSFIAPNVQELGSGKQLTPEHIEALNILFKESDLGERTVTIKIWDKDHRIVYSNNPALVGRKFSDTTDQLIAWGGAVAGRISDLQEEENIEERRLSPDPLLEIYSPVRLNDTDQIIALAEFYQKVDTLEAEIITAQRRSWLVVGTTTLTIYLLLVWLVQRASNRIEQQEAELKNQVALLTYLLFRNKALAERVRLAAANTAALNESFLRRTSADLHDGPVQEVSLALLRLGRAIDQNETCRLTNLNGKCNESLSTVQTSLQSALREMRAIATGLGLPELEGFTLREVFMHVVRSHEQYTRTQVILNMSDLPKQTTLPIKIAAYRFVQEGLKNAYRHADGKGQEVQVLYISHQMQIEVLDQGPGFDTDLLIEMEEHLGLAGMRERVESLGGLFTIESNLNKGTKLSAYFSLDNIGDNTNG